MTLAVSVDFSMPARIQRGKKFSIFQAIIFAQFITSTFCVRDNEIEDYRKVIFFHEILHSVEEPLQYAVWKQRGDKLQSNKDFYKEYNDHMEFFQQQYEQGKLLKSKEFFGALVKSHYEQAHGLFHFLYQPYDWNTFVQNTCWARQHLNAHMFVYAFTLAVIQRQLDHAMLLPKIYEILPRYFLDRTFVESSKEFNTNNFTSLRGTRMPTDSVRSNFNIWQWWKSITPYELTWHAYNFSNTSQDINVIPAEMNSMNLHAWWRPADYTRDFNIMNEHTKLAYFTEDVDWNAYWYHLNLLYPFFMPGRMLFWRNETRRGEFWLYSLQQLMTRYELERLSHGLEEIPHFEWHDVIEDGYDPRLDECNGRAFDARGNNFELKITVDNFDIFAESCYTLRRIEDTINNGVLFFKNGSKIVLKEPQSIEIISNLLQCNVDALDGNFNSNWYFLTLLYLAGGADHKNYEVQPNVLLNFETMLRDPLFYVFHKRIVADFQRFQAKLAPYTKSELQVAGLQIVSVHVSELVTYFDLFDLDVSNLQSIEPNQTVNNTLLARQMRLTHKPFHFNLTITTERPITVMLRVFLAPIQDKHGATIPLIKKRTQFLELHKFLVHLDVGENRKTFSYDKYFESTSKKDYSFQAKKYFDARNPAKRARLYESYDSVHYCGLSTRLLLPRGTVKGLPMHLFFTLNSLEDTEENQHHWWKLCLPTQGKRAFGFPFDRPIIDEVNFKNPNMYWKTVKIYHNEELFEEN